MNPRSLVSLSLAVLAVFACLVAFPALAPAQTGIGPLAALRGAARSNRDLVRQSRADALATRQANVELLRSTSFAPRSAALRTCDHHSAALVAPIVAAPLVQSYALPAAIVAPSVYAYPAPLVAPLIVPGYSLPATPLPAPAPLVAPPAALIHPTRAASTAALHAAQTLVVPRCSF